MALFDYNYWANWKILAAVRQMPQEQFTAPVSITWRNIRGTLVHTLDVEQSWRRRIRGEDEAVWDAELPAERFASAAALEAYWRSDAREMLDWLAELDDARLADTIDLGPRDQFPLWYFLVHIVTHGTEQRRDVSTLLRHFEHEAPELEFLWFADAMRELPPT
jgi:uncharacterized damage-inducible protein DinB